MNFHVEHIECPECKKVQPAQVDNTTPFWTYIHVCVQCEYIITESEWNTVENTNNLNNNNLN